MNDQLTLFERKEMQPLAARMRPQTVDEIVGQQHLLGKGKILRRIIEQDAVSSMIFWGPPGVGKTTLASLIPRFYDATAGTVLVDGVDVRAYTFDALYNKLGYVTQKAVLFSGTVEDNVFFGQSAAEKTDASLQAALSLSQAAEFVDKYPEKAAHPIAQLGRNVSGGQKQRLSIARALARKPEILIFDDSFSALDYKTDATLREGLAKELPGTTKIIVAQRISTIRNADQILVLDRGEIAGLGTHDELMVSCPVYREIAMSQLSEEELKKGGASK